MTSIYQCKNGHLVCLPCFNHLLADSRLRDETATCPNCRCLISSEDCTRNLAVEKAIQELPVKCSYCATAISRANIEVHERNLCCERLTGCRYERIGCQWRGPYHEKGFSSVKFSFTPLPIYYHSAFAHLTTLYL